tara:strand:- start:33 stop:266 length:234 start_codon:yes stop_codon:yes gene_type:complete
VKLSTVSAQGKDPTGSKTEEKLKEYLRSKYMQNDRITEDADWRDSINQFRMRTYQDIEEIFKKINHLEKELDKNDNN